MLSNIRCVMEQYPDHPWIRNYKKLILRDDYIRPEIAQCILLKGDEKVAILKTVWLRIIQRAWKKIFQERCRVRSQRETTVWNLAVKLCFHADHSWNVIYTSCLMSSILCLSLSRTLCFFDLFQMVSFFCSAPFSSSS